MATVYQMTQEQLDLLSNDLVEVLQQISTTHKDLQQLNETNKHLLESGDISRLDELLKTSGFLVDSAKLMKSELIDDFKGMEYLFKQVKEQTEKIDTLSKKFDKKSQFIPTKKSDNCPLLYIGGVAGFFIAVITLGTLNGFESLLNFLK